MARPQKQIDAAQVAKLAALGATHQEIADFFGADRSTIERRFAAEIDKGRTALKIRLRRLQLRAAERGNVTMLIWLGKALLGQADKPPEQVFPPATVQFIVHPPTGEIPPDDSKPTGQVI
jgi:hypothetical protein